MSMKLSKKFYLIVFFIFKISINLWKKNISFQKQCVLILSILPIAFGNILLPLFDFRSAPGFNASPCMGEWVFRAWMGEFSVHEFFIIVIIIIIIIINTNTIVIIIIIIISILQTLPIPVTVEHICYNILL